MKKIFFTIASLIILSIFGLGVQYSLAADYSGSETEQQLEAFAGSKGAELGDPVDVRSIMARIVKLFLGFVGILFLGYTVYGAYLFMTSSGQEERIAKGRKIIIHGVIGVVVILSSYGLVTLVYTMFERADSGEVSGVNDGSAYDTVDYYPENPAL